MSEILTIKSKAMDNLLKMLGLPDRGVTAFDLHCKYNEVPTITVTSEVWVGDVLTEGVITQQFELKAIETD